MIKRISAIVPIALLPALEGHLRECGVPGVTVERVQGYGKYPNYFRRDLMHDNARVILYADALQVDAIVAAITTCARDGGALAGIVTVESIDRLISLSDDAAAGSM